MISDVRYPADHTSRSDRSTVRRLHRASIFALQACLALLSAFMVAGNVAADTPAASSYAGGTGIDVDPFQIATLAQLRKFMEGPFPQHAYYILTATIDANDTSTWLSGAGWQPVDATLMNDFDGQNFQIQNLVINRPLEDNVGFFRIAGGLCCYAVKNLNIIGGHVTGRDSVGALIGAAGQFLTITNIQSTATVNGRSKVGGLAGVLSSGSLTGSSASGAVTGTSDAFVAADFVGGLAGQALGTTIASSHATGHVTGKKATGGLIGTFVQGSAPSLTSTWATGNVDGDDRVGGLIGESTGKVIFSFATGAVTATGFDQSLTTYTFAGGLIGIQDAHGVEDSWASGNVSGPFSGVGGLIGSSAGPTLRCATIAGQTVTGGASAGSVGGLIGDNQGQITSSRSASTVSASGTAGSVGGLVGSNASGTGIATSYATGSVTAVNAPRVGGLVGWHVVGAITDSHASGNVSGADYTGGLIGLSTTPAITNSSATGTVSGHSLVGGLIGSRGTGTTDTTFATGTVTATSDYAGGLIGLNNGAVIKSYAKPGAVAGTNWVGGLVGYNQRTIETSFATNSVSGTTYVGGLVGQSTTNSFGIRDCYARGAVTGSDKVGGLVGRNEAATNITRCYASGTVTLTGAGPIGALVGDNQGTATDDYWNAGTTAVVGIAAGTTTGATGLTSLQMKQQLSFTGFIFPSPWRIDEGTSEPYLDYAAVAVSASSTGLASSANPSVPGQSITFTATVTGTTPTGTVLFQDGTSPLSGCIAVTVTVNQAQCVASNFTLGSHNISAIYSGDGLNTSSTSSILPQVANKASTTTTIGSHTPDPSTLGSPIAVGATVSVTAPGAGTPSGTITVSDGTTNCLITLPATSCNLTPATTGAKTLTATYGGDGSFNGSVSPGVGQTVNGVSTTTGLAASVNPTVFGQSVTFTATVTGVTPTGTVTFKDGLTTLCNAVALASGQAGCSNSALTVGSHNMTAVYSGNATNAGSTSSILAQVVNKASTTTVIGTHTPAPSTVGSPIAVGATVSVTGPGAGTPGGTITVSDGTANCLITLPAVSCNLTPTSAGAKTLIATYSGNGSFNGSTSPGVSHTVNTSTTTTGLGASANPSVSGQSLTFTATVTGVTPTGTVTFNDGVTALCSAVTLASGQAQCISAALSVASHNMTAVYSGDANNSGSTSSILSQVVNKANTTAAIGTHTPNPSIVGLPIAVAAAVSVTAPGAGTPTGTITVSDGTVNCVITLPATSCNLTPTSTGAKTLTATYSGNGSFNGSTSPGVSQTVNNTGTSSTALGASVNPSVLGQSVTFTATVTAVTPTGTVTFNDGVTALCSAVALASGQAQCISAALTAGSHNMTAVYSGDANNAGSTSSILSQSVILGSLDIDGSNTASKYDALTDGLITIRYLFGLTGNSLVAGALGATATRTDPAVVKAYLDSIRPLLDIDGNGSVDALTDGLLILRYMFGLTGNALIAGAVDQVNGTRKTAPEIQTYIQSLMP